jgi:hypothetical protein
VKNKVAIRIQSHIHHIDYYVINYNATGLSQLTQTPRSVMGIDERAESLESARVLCAAFFWGRPSLSLAAGR